jgi:hypothetical protein
MRCRQYGGSEVSKMEQRRSGTGTPSTGQARNVFLARAAIVPPLPLNPIRLSLDGQPPEQGPLLCKQSEGHLVHFEIQLCEERTLYGKIDGRGGGMAGKARILRRLARSPRWRRKCSLCGIW